MPVDEHDDTARQGRGRPSADYRGDSGRGEALAATLSELARSLQDERDVHDTLQGIVAAAVQTIPGAQFASISVIEHRRKVITRAATDDLVVQVDEVQYVTGQGPCLDALYEHRTLRLADMSTESRWPLFAQGAVMLGVGSMLSIQLYVNHDDLGALNMYAEVAHAFHDDSEQIGLLFAAHAAVAMVGAQQRQQLSQAIAVRDLIGQAKGILMERHKLTGDQAFALLVQASQHTNIKLVEVAADLVDSGELANRRRR